MRESALPADPAAEAELAACTADLKLSAAQNFLTEYQGKFIARLAE